jgi:hypothetical protein
VLAAFVPPSKLVARLPSRTRHLACIGLGSCNSLDALRTCSTSVFVCLQHARGKEGHCTTPVRCSRRLLSPNITAAEPTTPTNTTRATTTQPWPPLAMTPFHTRWCGRRARWPPSDRSLCTRMLTQMGQPSPMSPGSTARPCESLHPSVIFAQLLTSPPVTIRLPNSRIPRLPSMPRTTSDCSSIEVRGSLWCRPLGA